MRRCKRTRGCQAGSGGSEGVTWSKVRLPARALARSHPTLQSYPLFFRQSSSLHHPHHFLSILPSALDPNLYYPPSPSSSCDFIRSSPPLLTCSILAYIDSLAWPRQKKAIEAHFPHPLRFVCSRSCRLSDRQVAELPGYCSPFEARD